MRAELKAFDPSLAINQAGGSSELAVELFKMLQRDLPEFKSTITMAHRSNDRRVLLESVHKLNGSATYCGVPALKSVVNNLESALKRDEREASDRLVEPLITEIDRLLQTDIQGMM